MKPGGVKMVFLTPDLSFACPKGRQCVADIEIDQRLAFYLELISVGEQQVGQQAPLRALPEEVGHRVRPAVWPG
jgi:hypothetical protein